MKTALTLIVAALCFYASVAWAGETTPQAVNERIPAVRSAAEGTAAVRAPRARAAQSRNPSRPHVVPASEPGATSAPYVLCACVRDRHSA